jgi:hypothetical protein
MPTLRSQLDALASSFANAVVDAIRGASLQELLATGGKRGEPAPRRAPSAAAAAPARPAKGARSGRLKRRSAEDIGKILDEVVSLVKSKKDGMRAEEIRTDLGLQSKELPRVLKEGLTSKRLRKSGQKRATVYFSK